MNILGHLISHCRPISKHSDVEDNNLTAKIVVLISGNHPKYLKIHKTTTSSLQAGKN